MVSNCSGERSFTKLKLIENRLRALMKQQKLVWIVIVHIWYQELINTEYTTLSMVTFCMYLKYSNLDVFGPILNIKTSNFR